MGMIEREKKNLKLVGARGFNPAGTKCVIVVPTTIATAFAT